MKYRGPVLISLLIAGWSTSSGAAHLYQGGAVATAHPIASHAALEMLDNGGNAVDAAVAAAFALAVVDPYHSGVGGGGFALVHEEKKGTDQVLDFREVAPRGASRDMYIKNGKVDPDASTDGPLSVAVPGAVKGYLELLARYGRLKPAQVLAPAIRAARNGYRVGPMYTARAQNRLACLKQDPEASRIFLMKDAQGIWSAPPAGTLLKQADLARTLELIAAQGEKVFYSGALAQAMVTTVQAGGGLLTKEDLASFKTRWREPLAGTYRGHRVLTIPPPSAGGVAILQVLGMLEKRFPAGLSYREPVGVHTFVEAVRRAYADRTKYLGDPAFVDIPLQRITSPDYIAQLAASIDPAHATPSASLMPVPGQAAGTDGGVPQDPGQKHTAHVSVIDREGNAVSMTTTINTWFGSCVVAKGTGILLNDEMDDFTARPGVPNTYGLISGEGNTIAPGKIPLSSMSGTLVFQKDNPHEVLLAVGSPGGSFIPTTVAQVIINVIDYGMDVTRAVGLGRVHHQYLPDVLMVERYGLENETIRALEARGHKIQRMEGWADAEAVFSDPVLHLRSAASDPRNEGGSLGQD